MSYMKSFKRSTDEKIIDFLDWLKDYDTSDIDYLKSLVRRNCLIWIREIRGTNNDKRL